MANWYRFDSCIVGFEGENLLEEYGVKVSIFIHEYPVVKETPKGVWLNVYGAKRFVLNDSIKKWAYPTKDAALRSFVRRKKRQTEILRVQLDHARAALKIALENKEPEQFEPAYVALSLGEL